MAPDLHPRDWLLLLFDGAGEPLDRVRIQKSMFLFAERSKAPGGEKYRFTPYHYGPFSFDIYPDLDWVAVVLSNYDTTVRPIVIQETQLITQQES